jgi:hypothetical protein
MAPAGERLGALQRFAGAVVVEEALLPEGLLHRTALEQHAHARRIAGENGEVQARELRGPSWGSAAPSE